MDERPVLDALGLAGNLETAALMERHCRRRRRGGAGHRLDQLYAGGKDDGPCWSASLSAMARDLLVRRTAPRAGSALMTGGFDETTLKNLSGRFDVPRLVQMLNLLQKTAADVVRSSNRRTDAELLLVTLCDPTLDQSPAGLNARVSRLEQGGVVAAAPVQAPTARPQSAPQPKFRPKAETPAAPEPNLPPWEVPQSRTRAREKAGIYAGPACSRPGGHPGERACPGAGPRSGGGTGGACRVRRVARLAGAAGRPPAGHRHGRLCIPVQSGHGGRLSHGR